MWFIVLSGVLFVAMGFAATRVPVVPARADRRSLGLDGIGELLGLPLFQRMLLVAALVMESHALNDAFAVIRRRVAGIGPGTISLLWSAAVASEVLVFVFVGPWLLSRLGTARAAMLAAVFGVIR
ncbi:hypothetical protein [Methylobacterium sp. ARG-1]|uniref:hypothetical protein n=1 Tax=Methylobacterium sp. ARG-1 TaxID=1692501 RepID=UPI00068046AC|nr:hypothetical protein [Methylobacterium sp. ARG-1]